MLGFSRDIGEDTGLLLGEEFAKEIEVGGEEQSDDRSGPVSDAAGSLRVLLFIYLFF